MGLLTHKTKDNFSMGLLIHKTKVTFFILFSSHFLISSLKSEWKMYPAKSIKDLSQYERKHVPKIIFGTVKICYSFRNSHEILIIHLSVRAFGLIFWKLFTTKVGTLFIFTFSTFSPFLCQFISGVFFYFLLQWFFKFFFVFLIANIKLKCC